MMLQDRDKMPKIHLADTVDELKRFNARRKLKGAVQAIAGGLATDPLCGADTDSGTLILHFVWSIVAPEIRIKCHLGVAARACVRVNASECCFVCITLTLYINYLLS